MQTGWKKHEYEEHGEAHPHDVALKLSFMLGLVVQVTGKYKDVPHPVDMSALFTVGSVSSTGFLFPFKIGAEVTIQVRQHKCTGCTKHCVPLVGGKPQWLQQATLNH
jgi:hypothetical protein